VTQQSDVKILYTSKNRTKLEIKAEKFRETLT